MGKALFLANRARETGDVPVGAVVVDESGRIIGRGANCREANHDPAGHAEIVALREAGRARGTWRLTGCTLIVTLEPCTMCAGAILASRIDRVVFGAWDPKAGAAGSLRDVLRDARMPHPTEVVGGVLAQEAAMQLRSFFLGCRAADEMPVVEAPVHEPGDIPAPIVVPYEEGEALEPIHQEAPNESVPAQLVTPAAPAAPVAAPQPAHVPAHAVRAPGRHHGTEPSPLPRRAGRPFSERVRGNADNPADIPAGESIEPGVPAHLPPSQPPYRSGSPVQPAVSADMGH
ncbi:MAG: tRNA adenosine(34) deaminase TadA, partial [Schaalia odontolytica]